MLLEKNISQTLFFNDSFFLDTTLENSSLIDSLEVIEVTKAAEKIKWINRFLKSYSGNINKKLNFEMIDKTRTFVATFQGKELGYTRVIDMTELFLISMGNQFQELPRLMSNQLTEVKVFVRHCVDTFARMNTHKLCELRLTDLSIIKSILKMKVFFTVIRYQNLCALFALANSSNHYMHTTKHFPKKDFAYN